MFLARPMTALATDGMALKDRRFVMIHRSRCKIGVVRVAVKARFPHRAVKMGVSPFITG